jgi:hypothetical protein
MVVARERGGCGVTVGKVVIIGHFDNESPCSHHKSGVRRYRTDGRSIISPIFRWVNAVHLPHSGTMGSFSVNVNGVHVNGHSNLGLWRVISRQYDAKNIEL